jgi:flagellar hook-associated protein 2
MNTIVETVDSSTSLYDLGMEVNRDGTITLDEDVLNTAISSDYNDVKDLFLGDEDAGVTGLGDLINDTLRDITMYSGLIDSEKDAAQDQIDRIEEDIETATERLDKRYEDMARQFAMLDVFMSRMQAQSTFIDEMFSAYKAASER